MNRYPAPELKDLPEDIKAKILEVQEKAGFVPNVFLALARRPAEWRAFFAYHDALMLKEEGSLTKGDREMIVTTTSAANNCLYCVVAHGALLRIYEKKPLVADQVAVNYRKADITPRQRAMLDFAMKVCLDSDKVGEEDFAPLHAHGFSDEDIWDIAAITAFFGLSNRLASFSNMMPNPEFYLMGRVPKQNRSSCVTRPVRSDQVPMPARIQLRPAAAARRLCAADVSLEPSDGRRQPHLPRHDDAPRPHPPRPAPSWPRFRSVLRPGSLTYIFTSTSPGYSSCL